MLEKIKNQINKRMLLIVLGVFFSLLLAAFYLNASALVWSDFLELSIEAVKSKALTLNFVLFLVFFCLALGFGCLGALKLKSSTAMLSVLIGSLPAVIFSFLFFSNVNSFFLLVFVIPIALMALTWTASIKLSEIKKFTRFRSFMAGIGTFTLIFALAVFLVGVIEIKPNQEQYLSKIENTLASGVSSGNLQEKIIKANLESQYRLLWNIHSSEQYSEMAQVNNEKVKAFDKYYIGIVSKLDKAIENPKEYMEDKGVKQGLDTHSLLMEQIPGYKLFSKYFFILYPLLLFTVVISIGNLIFRLLGSGFGLLFSVLLKNI